MTEEYGPIAIKFGIKKIDGTFREIVAMFDTGACSTLIEQEFLDDKDIEVKHVRFFKVTTQEEKILKTT